MPILPKAHFAAGLLLFATFLAAQTPPPPFTDVTERAGIHHQFAVHEGMFGGGVCVFDLNKDGFEDLFITGGMNDDQLYLNQGDGTFKNVYAGSGLELSSRFVTQGAVGADVNRDGWVDLFVTTITAKDTMPLVPRARNLLFLNQGNGTFRDATAEFGLFSLYSFSTGGSFGDFDADGWPDLYVGNYFINHEGPLTVISDATIAGAHQTARGYLLRNEGGKTFTNVYEKYGMRHRGFGFGGTFSDFDNDGDPDLLVHHDFGYKAVPSFLYENCYPWKKFKDASAANGMDLKINDMGAAVGDFNDDGRLDYFVTNIRFNRFMVNQGPGKPFEDKSKELGTHQMSISWGANFADFDQDGDLDLFVANGDLNPNCTAMGDFYFENDAGKFTEKSRAMGLNCYGIGRGSVTFDVENDGDLDILVVNQKPVQAGYPDSSTTRLFRNDLAKGNWLKVALIGFAAETHGLGARVLVVAGGKRQIREIDGGSSSHLSQNSTIAHFGLGAATAVDSVVVVWPGGKTQILTGQAVNTLLTVRETPGRYTPPVFYYAGLGVALLLLSVWFWVRRFLVAGNQR